MDLSCYVFGRKCVATVDKHQNLYSFTVSMSTKDPPVFNYYRPILDESGMPSGRMRLAKGDTIPTMCSNEDNQKIYCGSIILGMSASIFVPEGSSRGIMPNAGVAPKFAGNLQEICTLATDLAQRAHVTAPISSNRRKRTAM